MEPQQGVPTTPPWHRSTSTWDQLRAGGGEQPHPAGTDHGGRGVAARLQAAPDDREWGGGQRAAPGTRPAPAPAPPHSGGELPPQFTRASRPRVIVSGELRGSGGSSDPPYL
ncbi:hypothetical protein HaLaN_25929, partial [Haematococcus lacustris]